MVNGEWAARGEGVSVAGRGIVEALREFFSGRAEVVAAYLFGSWATGRERKGSDVDVAIMSRVPLDGWQRIELETELCNHLGRDVDLVRFDGASALLKHQVLRDGILLVEHDRAERISRETRGRYEYMDTKFLHKELRA